MEKDRMRRKYIYEPEGEIEVMRQITDVYDQGFIDSVEDESNRASENKFLQS